MDADGLILIMKNDFAKSCSFYMCYRIVVVSKGVHRRLALDGLWRTPLRGSNLDGANEAQAPLKSYGQTKEHNINIYRINQNPKQHKSKINDRVKP